MSLFEDFKYDHPRAYRLCLLAVAVTLAGVLVASVPDNEATRAMGLIALKDRCVALKSAIYWESRAAMAPEGALTPKVEFGFVLGVDFDGAVFVQLPDKTEFVRQKVLLADVQLVDLDGVAAAIQEKRQMDAKIEMYGDMAVIWIDGVPLNVELVTRKLARPDPNPPTNIVDRIFATYFWNKVKGNTI